MQRNNRLARRGGLACFALISLLFLSACGGGGTSSSMGTVPVNLTIRDTPPSGLTVLSFELQITGAMLQPGNVSLMSESEEVELTQLQAQSAFLSASNVQAGNYTSLVVTLANPELTILNDTGATIMAGTQSCANGQVCEIEPQMSPVMVTITSSPFPLTLTTNSPVRLELDVNLNNAIQFSAPNVTIDFTAAGAVSVTQLPAPQEEDEFEDDVHGVITSLGTNQFMLTTFGGMTLTINVNGNTQFNFEDSSCQADNFSCLATGQFVEASVAMQPDGSLLAREVDVQAEPNQLAVKGTIISLGGGSPPTSFQMVIHLDEEENSGMAVGNTVTVNISGATFTVDNRLFALPSGLMFASASDLLVGQEVRAGIIISSINLGPPISFSSSQIALEASHLTAKVASVNAPNFTLSSLPSLFASASPAITQIAVDTTQQTMFENFTGLSNLTTGNLVSVRGFLFNTVSATGSPTLAAEAVELQQGEM